MKQRGKKSLKITDAVVRGGKNAYEFEVFPIETEFESQSAIYIFSQRKIDKTGRGHQKFFCIGQTNSLDGEFAKYKKDFASKYRANVICVRIEEEENQRLKIEEELKAAYNISCANNLEKAAQAGKNKIIKSVSQKTAAPQPKKQISVEKISASGAEKPIVKEISAPIKKEARKREIKQVETPAKKVEKAKQTTSKSKLSKTTVAPVKSKTIKPTAKSTQTKPASKLKSNSAVPQKNSATKAKATSPVIKRESQKPAIKNLKISVSAPKTTRNQKTSQKLKGAGKPKNAEKTVKQKNRQKVLTAKSAKSGDEGKLAKNVKSLPIAKKPVVKDKKRTAKQTSRKQLAF